MNGKIRIRYTNYGENEINAVVVDASKFYVYACGHIDRSVRENIGRFLFKDYGLDVYPIAIEEVA